MKAKKKGMIPFGNTMAESVGPGNMRKESLATMAGNLRHAAFL